MKEVYTAKKLISDYKCFILFFTIDKEDEDKRYIQHLIGYKKHVNTASLTENLKELKVDKSLTQEFRDNFENYFVDIIYDMEVVKEILSTGFGAENN